MVDELAAVVRVADRVRIPLHFQPLQFGAVLRQTDDYLINVDARTQPQKPTVRRSHPENSTTQNSSDISVTVTKTITKMIVAKTITKMITFS